MVILLIIAGFCIWYYLANIAPAVNTVIEETVRAQVSKAIDDMTDNELQNVQYDDFVITRFDEGGNITLMQINSINADIFARKVTAGIREEMKKFEKEGISINLGTMSGISFLSGIGPSIEFTAINLGVVDAAFFSEFLSGGVNQTLHRLYMRIEVDMSVTLPGKNYKIKNGSDVMICESVISGKVPDSLLAVSGTPTGDLLP